MTTSNEATTPWASHKCAHVVAGWRIKAASGLLFQWCSKCGALGVRKPGVPEAWIQWTTPNEHAEDLILEAVRRVRAHV